MKTKRYVYVILIFAVIGIVGVVLDEINIMEETQFPLVIQDEPVSCGAACLTMIFQYYGKEYTFDYLKKMTKTDPVKGVSMLSLKETAESLGFETMGVRISFKSLKDKAVLPCIVHWNADHFVVVYNITEDFVFVADPAVGRIEYSHKEFCDHWIQGKLTGKDTGLALLMRPPQE